MIPNYQDHVAAVAAKHPEAWRAAPRGGPRTEDYIRLLAAELYAIDPRVGLNGKRGNPDDISDDALCVKAPGKSLDVRTGESVTVIDVIAGAGGPDPRPSWGEVWDPNQVPTKATWVQPAAVVVPSEPPVTPPPPPPPTPSLPPELVARLDTIQRALTFVIDQIATGRNDSLQIHSQLGTLNQRQDALAAQVEDVRGTLRNGLAISGDAVGRTVLGTIKLTLTGKADG
jgi:hypothetical protein